MDKAKFLILCNNPVTSYMLANAIQFLVPEKRVFETRDTDQAMQVLERITRTGDHSEEGLPGEVRVLLDVRMPYLEAFVFLYEIYLIKFPFPVQIYMLEDPDESKELWPDMSRYQGVKGLVKGTIFRTVEQVVNDHTAEYFRHDTKARFPVYL